MKRTLTAQKNEKRKDYLARVTVFFLENIEDIISGETVVIYDEAHCDWLCLADDIKNEYSLECSPGEPRKLPTVDDFNPTEALDDLVQEAKQLTEKYGK